MSNDINQTPCPAPVCSGLLDAVETVGEMDCLLTLGIRVALKRQDFAQAIKLRDAKHLLAGRNPAALLHEESL